MSKTTDPEERRRNRRLRGYTPLDRTTQFVTVLGALTTVWCFLSLPTLERFWATLIPNIDTLGALGWWLWVGFAVVVIGWVNTAFDNLKSFAVPGLRSPDRPGFWFFLPGPNLVVPFRALTEIWQGSDPDVPEGDPAWKQRPRSMTGIAAWLSALIGAGAAMASWPDGILGEPSPREDVVAISLQFLATATVLGVFYAHAVQRRQEKKRRRLLIPKDLVIGGPPSPMPESGNGGQ